MANKKLQKGAPRQVSPRKHRHIFMLNDLENKALNRYLHKYKVKNKSKFIRETLMFEVIRRFEQDQPTLFDDVTE